MSRETGRRGKLGLSTFFPSAEPLARQRGSCPARAQEAAHLEPHIPLLSTLAAEGAALSAFIPDFPNSPALREAQEVKVHSSDCYSASLATVSGHKLRATTVPFQCPSQRPTSEPSSPSQTIVLLDFLLSRVSIPHTGPSTSQILPQVFLLPCPQKSLPQPSHT